MAEVKQKRKYNKKSEYWGANITPQTGAPNFSGIGGAVQDITKAGNTDQSVSRLRLGELGSPALATVQYFIDWLKPWELRWPQRIRTFSVMSQDQDVSTALDANYMFVEEAFDDFEISFLDSSDKSVKAAAFVDWCLRNMEGQTLRQVVRSAITYRKYGFSILEKVYTKVTSGEYAGKYKIKRLPLRPQETIDINQPFVYTDGGRDIRGVRQNTTYFMNSPAALEWTPEVTKLVVEIPRGKFMLFNTNADDTNPMGESPLISIYNAWREKKLISEYEVVGVTKDMGGERYASL